MTEWALLDDAYCEKNQIFSCNSTQNKPNSTQESEKHENSKHKWNYFAQKLSNTLYERAFHVLQLSFQCRNRLFNFKIE